ncbi:RagB/SusD family nutrient uptake outer membrane protein [Pedobacter frigidisoli]|uniref:RagB/SusD family nutrient uptake outer membrane protein n=1 Tax=Pedobacter frigidisoli TaxID=2530455 RepID=UPI00292D8C52|nr:RagB/SusD family nutrient uptake outer membrane protein [Pedobacter frigidisoli]
MKTRFLYLTLIIVISVMHWSCEKYLEEKPNKRISTPDKLSDLQGILDNYAVMNGQYPSAGETSADDYYLNDASWSSSTERQRNLYLWQKYDVTTADWNPPYKVIFNANLIIETIPTLKLSDAEQTQANVIKGQALFLRSFYHLAVVQLFATTYNNTNAASQLGIPLKLVSDVEAKSVRPNLAETYAQILADVKAAVRLLPNVSKAKYLATKPAAWALLARTNLLMGNYQDAALYADSCLQVSSTLIDYNSVSTTATIPFAQFNDEVIYDCRTAVASVLAQTKAKVDPVLYASYASNDLRKTVFFKKNTDATYAFKGNYTGLSTAVFFSGMATDEVLLIRAECKARLGLLGAAAGDLNTLLSKRYKTGTFSPYTFTNQAAALSTVLLERRKELLFRNLRWPDLKRLNQEPAQAITLSRTIKQVVYTLKPGDIRYVLPIDKTAIQLSGMEQNP